MQDAGRSSRASPTPAGSLSLRGCVRGMSVIQQVLVGPEFCISKVLAVKVHAATP